MITQTRYEIFGELKNGEVVHCFVWRGTPEDGIRRAERDARLFGKSFKRFWSQPIQVQQTFV